jgi:hypothetical protein
VAILLDRKGDVVTLSICEPAAPDDGENYIAALETLSRTASPFLLLVDVTRELALSPEHRKAQNLWYKSSRDRLERRCRAAAIVRIRPTAEAAQAFQRLWRFPVAVLGDRRAGEAFLAAQRPETGPL